jgi:hypothetical protein
MSEVTTTYFLEKVLGKKIEPKFRVIGQNKRGFMFFQKKNQIPWKIGG